MDTYLKQITELAAMRGSKYIKGEVGLSELPQKMAELGIFLIEKSCRIADADEAATKEELIEVQQKLDDLRKAIFANKLQPKRNA